MAPREIAVWALRAGLHGVVLTDHDVLWAAEELSVLQGEFPEVRFYRGIECSALEAHLVVIGIDDAAHLHTRIAVQDALDVVHAGGGVCILAHPFRDCETPRFALDGVDAIEVASTSFSRADSARAFALARQTGKPAVASSDAHALGCIGWGCTEFPRLPVDERELAALVKEGVGVPMVRGSWPQEGGGRQAG